MATLNSLKVALREKAIEIGGQEPVWPLSDEQYGAGFDILLQGEGMKSYKEFIIPQLSQLLASLLHSRVELSVLEIGPGPTSVLEHLEEHQRRRIGRYTAIEPNELFRHRLKERLCPKSSPLPCLHRSPDIYERPFTLEENLLPEADKFDLILLCHSLYGIESKRAYLLSTALWLADHGLMVIFHRDGSLNLDDLVCHRVAWFPTGIVCIPDDNAALDRFASFIVGSTFCDKNLAQDTRIQWCQLCRTLGRRERDQPEHLYYSAPEVMFAFKNEMQAHQELQKLVPIVEGERTVKNRQASSHRPAAVFRPTKVEQVQKCVRWAIKHGMGLTILGKGHSGHCQLTNVVTVDMSAFDQVHTLPAGSSMDGETSTFDPLIVAEVGCTAGDIITKAMEVGLTVPLGARPSVGAGLWLQGGIGHLARVHGLTCDSILGAVVVRVDTGEVVYVGDVPRQHRPVESTHEKNQADLLWALKGAGTNFGIVISVTFKAYEAPKFAVRSWVTPMSDGQHSMTLLGQFDQMIAKRLPPHYSSDAYLFWENNKFHLGITLIRHLGENSSDDTSLCESMEQILGPADTAWADANIAQLFGVDMYMSRMHGGHGGGKTSAFKRCVFLKDIGAGDIARFLVAAIETRPWPLCYLHLLHGGGAVSAVGSGATAFGCRDWDFACVITAVWPRDQDGTELARVCEQWVYTVIKDLLPLSRGVYGADLGPDPRDLELAAKAFGPNGQRLSRLKQMFDPYNVLPYACPLPKGSTELKAVILITGPHGVGKDFFAAECVSMFRHRNLKAQLVSISDETKREYALASGADLSGLLRDRVYKEQHRMALEEFFELQKRLRPRLPEEHFLKVVRGAADTDVLFITGMRDEAPVTALSHLIPDMKLLDIRIKASEQTRQARRRFAGISKDASDSNGNAPRTEPGNYLPSLTFDNTTSGVSEIQKFAERVLFPLFHSDIYSLSAMVSPPVANFPRTGSQFCHVLNIAQKESGLRLCTHLLESHFTGDWTKVDAIVSPETGGLVFASPLAATVSTRLIPVRAAGKLPPPTVSVTKPSSYISSLTSRSEEKKTLELGVDAIPGDASVVVIDDVFSTGKTLCAVLELLKKAGVSLERVSVMVVAEFPIHGGRRFLQERGFGRVRIQNLLVFGVA